MTVGKRITFAALTVALLLATIEGVARLVWWRLESRALSARAQKGELLLRNNSINFLNVHDGRYGYRLKPGLKYYDHYINEQGFAQRDVVPVSRAKGVLRVVAMGESTTQGLDSNNYPMFLKRVLRERARGQPGAEVINAGVSGWVSDQVALYAECQLAAFRPDIVVLYTGWNDFQGYDPFGAPPEESWFVRVYGDYNPGTRHGIRSLQLLSAAYAAQARNGAPRAAIPVAAGGQPSPGETYRFLIQNLDRIVAAYRRENPDVKVAVSTLVGRWPHGTRQDFEGPTGRTAWMSRRELTPERAAAALDRFNLLLAEYARSRGLVLIDSAAAFRGLDRGVLQYDFAHMHPEGYELLAETIYDGLVRTGTVDGEMSPRFAELTAKYTRPGGDR